VSTAIPSLQEMKGVPPDQLPSTLLEKLARWDMVDLLDVIPRNMGVLLR